MNRELLEKLIGLDVGHGSRLTRVLVDAIEAEQLDVFEAQAVARAVRYSDQIADISIGNIYREELARITKED